MTRREFIRSASSGLLIPAALARPQSLTFPGPGAGSHSGPPMWTLISHMAEALGLNGGTTGGSIDITGANLVFVAVPYSTCGAAPALSDSLGNTWTQLGDFSGAGSCVSAITSWYCANPTHVGVDNFTITGSSSFPAVFVQAWSGAAASPLDIQTGLGPAAGLTISPGGITPSASGELVITALSVNNTISSFSVDSGFTIDFSLSTSGALAYLIQPTAGALSPTWTVDVSGWMCSNIVAFAV